VITDCKIRSPLLARCGYAWPCLAGCLQYLHVWLTIGVARQGEGDELQQVRAKLQGILEARKDQYANADIHVGLGGADSPLGAPPAVITLRCMLDTVPGLCIVMQTLCSAA